MKTHALTGITGAVKNQLGVIVGQQKARCMCSIPTPTSFPRCWSISIAASARVFIS
jgi:uncharacterized protein (DUF362 family)